MGPGGFCGLQNRLRRLNCRWVGSIPTRSRHREYKASEVFTLGAFLFCHQVLCSVGVKMGKIYSSMQLIGTN